MEADDFMKGNYTTHFIEQNKAFLMQENRLRRFMRRHGDHYRVSLNTST
jgi:phage antirepressor YoqD-like protein